MCGIPYLLLCQQNNAVYNYPLVFLIKSNVFALILYRVIELWRSKLMFIPFLLSRRSLMHALIQLSYSSHTALIQLSYSSHTALIQLSYSSHTALIQLSYSSHTALIQLSYSSHTALIQLSYSSHTALIQLSYSSHTAGYHHCL